MTRAPQIAYSDDTPAGVECDALVVGAFSKDDGTVFADDAIASDLLDGRLSDVLGHAGFKGNPGEVLIVPTLGELPARAIAVAGLGSKGKADSSTVRKAAASAARKLAERSVIASTLHGTLDDGAAAAAEGYLLGGYGFEGYKGDSSSPKIEQFIFLGADPQQTQRGVLLAEATSLARDLVNEPANMLTPEKLASKAQELATANDLGCTIHDEGALDELGCGGVLGVAQGSSNPPRLIELRYVPEGAAGKVALVGKGVTFDSGGLSIKPAGSMEEMKTDMAGAAAVIATMSILQKLEAQTEVLAYLPAVENMVGGDALRPGDVIRHYGGRTTEVLNTDAEGRLILADALALASEQGPDAIVDVATLTGSIVIALGKKLSGLFCTDDSLCDEILDAGMRAGERFWRMPLVDDYAKELDSDVADAKNIATRWGGSIFAALFLRNFVGKEVPWAHLDIAGTARADSNYDEVTKGGSGFATRTLINWIDERSQREQ